MSSLKVGSCPNSSQSGHTLPSHKATSVVSSDRSFLVEDRPLDLRDYLLPGIFLLCLLFYPVLPRQIILLAFTLRYGAPPIIRSRYPTFGQIGILDDLKIEAGTVLSFVGSLTSLILQVHGTSISATAKARPDVVTSPLIWFMKKLLYEEILLNGTPIEKDQIASSFRYLYPQIGRSALPSMDEVLQTQVNAPEDGCDDESTAYIMETFIWTTLAFQERFGRRLSTRAKDAVVLQYTCAGLRMGVSSRLLPRDYESFLVSFQGHLQRLDVNKIEPTREVIRNIESATLETKSSVITSLLLRAAWMIGYDLLPVPLKEGYVPRVLNSKPKRILQRILSATLWFVYPSLLWNPLRGTICFLLILEPSLRSALQASLNTVHQLDPFGERADPKDFYLASHPFQGGDTSRMPYLPWLGLSSWTSHPTVLQSMLFHILEVQTSSRRVLAWITFPWKLLKAAVLVGGMNLFEAIMSAKVNIAESQLFYPGGKWKPRIQLPRHVGFIVDGNRRFARMNNMPTYYGHACGTITVSRVLEWVIKCLPNVIIPTASGASLKYITMWIFSMGNFGRPKEELDILYKLIATQCRSIAFNWIFHLFKVRVNIIGSEDGIARFPPQTRASFALVEEATKDYGDIVYILAAGYGGDKEIAEGVNRILEKGKAVTEESISAETYCSSIGVPPVDIIIRTSENRTSGFFLWDTKTAELHFINKYWPQLTERDWVAALRNYAGREMRMGR